jgi:hypothetical protein
METTNIGVQDVNNMSDLILKNGFGTIVLALIALGLLILLLQLPGLFKTYRDNTKRQVEASERQTAAYGANQEIIRTNCDVIKLNQGSMDSMSTSTNNMAKALGLLTALHSETKDALKSHDERAQRIELTLVTLDTKIDTLTGIKNNGQA